MRMDSSDYGCGPLKGCSEHGKVPSVFFLEGGSPNHTGLGSHALKY
jgi:hypothetical protein